MLKSFLTEKNTNESLIQKANVLYEWLSKPDVTDKLNLTVFR
jgi:hypothetical protein